MIVTPLAGVRSGAIYAASERIASRSVAACQWLSKRLKLSVPASRQAYPSGDGNVAIELPQASSEGGRHFTNRFPSLRLFNGYRDSPET